MARAKVSAVDFHFRRSALASRTLVTLLLVSYGRMPLGRALLRGGMLAWGRRPWLGLRFKGMFFNP
jgi:hypothetical protein